LRAQTGVFQNSLLNDHYYRTRYHAAEALAKIGASSAIPNLKEALKNEFVTDVRVEMDSAIRLLQNQE
jgi:HEAT repeat protein